MIYLLRCLCRSRDELLLRLSLLRDRELLRRLSLSSLAGFSSAAAAARSAIARIMFDQRGRSVCSNRNESSLNGIYARAMQVQAPQRKGGSGKMRADFLSRQSQDPRRAVTQREHVHV